MTDELDQILDELVPGSVLVVRGVGLTVTRQDAMHVHFRDPSGQWLAYRRYALARAIQAGEMLASKSASFDRDESQYG